MHAPLLQICRRYAVKAAAAMGLILSLCQPASAQGPGGFSGGILLLSPSATANGMGNGFVAASTEASALYYNPAALTRTGRLAIEGNTFKLIPDDAENVRYYHLAGALRTEWLGGLWLGAAYSRVGLGQQIITDETGPEILGVFESYEWALSFAAAMKFGRSARLGIGLKYVRSVLAPALSNLTQKGDGRASAYALDLGFLYDGFLPSAHASRRFLSQPLPWSKWTHKGLPPGFSLGIAIANIGPQIEYIDAAQKDPLPQTLRVGLAWNIFESDLLSLAATGELAKSLVRYRETGEADGALKAIFTAWGDRSLHDEFSEEIYEGGFELSILQLLAIRFGRHWNGDSQFGYNTFGYSIGPPGIRFSFAKISTDDQIPLLYWRRHLVSPGERSIYGISIGWDKLP